MSVGGNRRWVPLNVRQHGFVNCVLTNDLLQNSVIGYTCRLSGCGKVHHYLLHPVTEKADENDCGVNSHSAPEGSEKSSCCKNAAHRRQVEDNKSGHFSCSI